MSSANSPTLLRQGIGRASYADVSAGASLRSAASGHVHPRPPEPKFSRDQGIIMIAVDGIEPEEYVYALGEITHPTNIINFSKISNNRIRIYLKDKTIVENITNKYKFIKVQDINITIRPLNHPSKRLIISGASPEIPATTIKNELIRLGLKPTSELFFLRAGLKRANFEHILSSKRCIYVERDSTPIPETTFVILEDLPNRIFLNDDSLLCDFCKKHGHEQDSCRRKINNQPPTLTPQKGPIPPSQQPETTPNQLKEHPQREIPITTNPINPNSLQTDPSPSEPENNPPQPDPTPSVPKTTPVEPENASTQPKTTSTEPKTLCNEDLASSSTGLAPKRNSLAN